MVGFQPREINRAAIPLACLRSWGSLWEPEVQPWFPAKVSIHQRLSIFFTVWKILKSFNKISRFSIWDGYAKVCCQWSLELKSLAVISEKCNQNTVSKKLIMLSWSLFLLSLKFPSLLVMHIRWINLFALTTWCCPSTENWKLYEEIFSYLWVRLD